MTSSAIATENALRFEVRSAQVLHTLVAAALPLGLRAGRPKRSFHRDIYVDTPDGELQRRGVSCRFRIGMDDRRTLRVVIRSAVAGGSLIEYDHFESEVPEIDPLESLRGSAEPARRLRAVIDPLQLGIRVELQTERISRLAQPRWLPIKTFDIAYDTIGVHSGGLSRTFHEIRIQRLAPGGPSIEELGAAFQRAYGIRPMPARRLERAEELLSAMESESLPSTKTQIPEVAVVAVADGRIAMRFDGGVLRLPVREGRGEKASRQTLQENVGVDQAELNLLGTVAASPSAAAMEVWLARYGTPDDVLATAPTLRWVSFADTIALAGAPVLRDGRTLAALSLLVRDPAFDSLCGVAPGAEHRPGALTREELRAMA